MKGIILQFLLEQTGTMGLYQVLCFDFATFGNLQNVMRDAVGTAK